MECTEQKKECTEHWHTLAPQLPGHYHSHFGNTMMPRQFYQVNSITRINQLQEYAGHWRVAAGQDTYGSDSESDDSSGEEDDGYHETLGPPPTISHQHNNQKRPNHCQNNQNASAANCLTRVSQTAPREYTQQRESSGARSGPPSPWYLHVPADPRLRALHWRLLVE